jgi:hypothetical protein
VIVGLGAKAYPAAAIAAMLDLTDHRLRRVRAALLL